MIGKTHHACALEINQSGILIKGRSGSGKTSLMMGLLERAKLEGYEAYLIADDQVILNSEIEFLEASVPSQIAGLVEIRGYGVVKHSHKSSTKLKLIVELIDDKKIERMPEPKFYELENATLPLLELPEQHESQALRIIFAWLNENAVLHVD